MATIQQTIAEKFLTNLFDPFHIQDFGFRKLCEKFFGDRLLNGDSKKVKAEDLVAICQRFANAMRSFIED